MEFILEEENALNVYLEVQTEQNMKFGAFADIYKAKK